MIKIQLFRFLLDYINYLLIKHFLNHKLIKLKDLLLINLQLK